MMHQTFFAISTTMMIWITCSLSAMAQRTATADKPLPLIKHEVMTRQAILLDVRENAEWDEAHLKDARLIPMSVLRDKGQMQQALQSLDKNLPIYCHCKAGGRAQVCAELLRQHGFDIRPLVLEYKQLVAAGFEEVRSDP